MFRSPLLASTAGLIAGLFLFADVGWTQQQPPQNSRIDSSNPSRQKLWGAGKRVDAGKQSRTIARMTTPSSELAAKPLSYAANTNTHNASSQAASKSVPAISASHSRVPPAYSRSDDGPALEVKTASPKEESPSLAVDPEDSEDNQDEPTAWRLFTMPRLSRHQVEVNGWWANGVTWNPDRPVNRLNGPIGVNDRANDYMFHQVGLSVERAVDPGESRHQLGSRIDLMYGADARLVQSAGFDDTWHSGRFVSLAMPQVYLEWFDPTLNPFGQGVSFRVGRFWSPIGYEGVPSLDRFFFSATHAFMLAQPATHTGVLATADIGANWTTQAGIVRGWDVTTDNNDSPGFIGTLGWLSNDEAASITHVLYHGNESDDLADAQTTYELILTRQLTDQWSYVGWFDFNFAQRIATNQLGEPSNAQWFSLNQALLYAISDKTSWGVRGEWFHDDDGVRITDPESGDLLGPGNLFGLTFGINHTPTMNLLLRPEIRWDWSSGVLPYDDATSSRQFTAGLDVVLSF